MRHPSLFAAVAALVLAGAGCAAEPVVPSNPQASASSAPAPAQDSSASALTVNTTPPPDNQALKKTWTYQGVLPKDKIENRQIRIETDKGTIVFELFDEEAPITVSNFIYLAKGGYFDGLTFHRYEPGFVIQGGDPLGNGTGGPGYQFEDEPVKRTYDKGIVAMANAGPDTNGSQFFIMLSDYPLPPAYTIFGKVTKGLDVVDQIRRGDVMKSVIVEAKSR